MYKPRISDVSESSDGGGGSRRSRATSLSLDWDSMVKLDQTRLFSQEMQRERMRPTETFCTGSQYTGTWNVINMQGFGTYVLPHNVEYEGDMSDGMFHGEGTMTYPCGYKIMGTWERGRLVSFRYQSPDGLMYSDPWNYCKHPDRRFFVEHEADELMPAGREVLTNDQPTKEIPEGCYDVGDGFYIPSNRCVVAETAKTDDADAVEKGEQPAEDQVTIKFKRIVDKEEHTWIQANCRKAWDEPTGYRKDLYDHWFSGRETELQNIKQVEVYYNV